jgi:hypothetical protein
MPMKPGPGKLALGARVASSVGWIGAVKCFLALALAGLANNDGLAAPAAYVAIDIVRPEFKLASAAQGPLIAFGSSIEVRLLRAVLVGAPKDNRAQSCCHEASASNNLDLSAVPVGTDIIDLEIRTLPGGILCETPFQLRKATVAAHRGDERRVHRLGCVATTEGVKAGLIDQRMPLAGPWQVQLMPEDRPAFTMWGYASSFKFKPNKVRP